MYTEEGQLYRELNTFLRAYTEELFENNLSLILYMLLLMYSIKSCSEKSNSKIEKKAMQLYRGICLPTEEAFKKFIIDYVEDNYIITKDFLSTSKNMEIANFYGKSEEDYKIIFKITVEPTKLFFYTLKSSDISHFSTFQQEDEVLINPFHVFKVKKIGKLISERLIYNFQVIILFSKKIEIEIESCTNHFADIGNYLCENKEFENNIGGATHVTIDYIKNYEDFHNFFFYLGFAGSWDNFFKVGNNLINLQKLDCTYTEIFNSDLELLIPILPNLKYLMEIKINCSYDWKYETVKKLNL